MKGKYGTYKVRFAPHGYTYFESKLYARIPHTHTFLETIGFRRRRRWDWLHVYSLHKHEYDLEDLQYAKPKDVERWEKEILEAYEEHYEEWALTDHEEWQDYYEMSPCVGALPTPSLSHVATIAAVSQITRG